VHKGMGITDAEFDAAAGHLQKALEKNGVKPDDVKAIMSVVGTTRKDIVEPKPEPATKLYDRIGGEKGIAKVVDDFVATAAPDPKVNFFRQGPNFKPEPKVVVDLKRKLVEQISTVSGGPLKYTGRSMKVAHEKMGITNAEFDATAGHLKKAL